MAETGKIDTTLIVVLHRNTDDSAVVKERPRYVAKLDGKGFFQFRNLAPGTYAMYSIPNDYSKRYDDTTKPFAFSDTLVNAVSNRPTTLYAYQLQKVDTGTVKPKAAAAAGKAKEDKLLRYQPSFEDGKQSLLNPLKITFNKPITSFDSTKVTLLGPDSAVVSNYRIVPDTNKARFTVLYNWPENTPYRLIFLKGAFADSTGTTLAKNDTLRFNTKRIGDYGSVKLRLKNLNLSKSPVLQLVQNDKVVDSIPLRQSEWSRKLYEPGEYEVRLLYDNNKNGKWDPGKFFGARIQPEIVVIIDTKLTIRPNFDNEKDLTL
jgi:hypothetical protein